MLTERDVERAVEQLREYTRRKGLRNSTVREAVARVALRQRGHFSIDDLVAAQRGQSGDTLHAATAYRIMPILVDAGLLRVTLISTADGALYERAFEREHHDHLVCTACGTVIEFHFEAIEVLQQDLAKRFGFTLTSHVHELLGLCNKCSKPSNAGTRKQDS